MTRAHTPRRQQDPVGRYAWDVAHERELAGRAVRLTCERHLQDLARQRTAEFSFWFSRPAAQHVIDFFPQFLTLEDGQPFRLTPWQAFCAGALFGWRRTSDDGRRFQIAYIETGKGTGKTPFLAGLGLYVLAFDDEPAAEIYSAAFDRDQASILLRDAIRMASQSSDLAGRLEIGKHNIAHLASGSFFRAVSSEHRSKSGPRPHVVLIDELHEHRDGRVVNKMLAGFKGRRQPMMLEITNSGHDKTSICWQHHEYATKVLEGALVDDTWFSYVCQLDPCAACLTDGYTAPRDGCEACDDWTDPAVWPKVNPSIGVTVQASYLAKQVERALAMPSDQALIKRLNFCLWTETHSVWIPPDVWHACAVPASRLAERADGRACAAGWDMSEKLDLTACVLGLRVDDDDVATGDVIELTDSDQGKETTKKLTINFCVELHAWFWLPEDTLVKRVQDERIPFDVWAREGWLRVTPGPVIDYDLIYEQFCTEIAPPFRPDRVGYDKHNATQFALQLRDRGKFTVVDVPQHRALSETFKLFEALVRLKRIRHNGNPVLAWCVSNAEPKRDRFENLYFEKPSQTKRIDGVIASAIALSQLVLLPPRRRTKRRAPQIWTPDGFKPILAPEVVSASSV